MTGRRIRNQSVFKFAPFSQKQRKLLNWWTKESPVKDYDGIIADGAIRSGKTVAMSLSFVMWAMTNYSSENFIMAGKTIGSFERNVLNVLLRMLPSRGYRADYRRGDKLLTIIKGHRVNFFYIFGGRDESSQDLVQGLTAAGLFLDEVALMPQSFVNQATGRCSVAGSKFFFNCNPDGPYHWVKTEWIDKSWGKLGKEEAEEKERKAREKDEASGLKKLLYLHFTMDDNLSLTEEIKRRYRSQYSGVFYLRYILGEWRMAEGVVYDMFDEEKHVKPISEFADQLVDGDRYVSIDYGTQNPTAMLLWCKGRKNVWYCCREYYYSGRDEKKQKTDGEYADDLVEWLEGTKVKGIIVDPSAASFIAELRKRKYHVIKADNDVLDGIRLVQEKLIQRKIIIAASCKSLIKEFYSYVWDEKAGEKGIDQPIKKSDHALDALRYFIYTKTYKLAKIKDKDSSPFN